MRYAGADWMRESAKVDLSPLGEKVADILGTAWRGIYHIQREVLHKRVEWGNTNRIGVVVRGDLATFDFDHLTTLVVLAHDKAVRVSVEGRSSWGHLLLTFSPRQREGGTWERHPTMDAATANVHKMEGDADGS